MSALLLMLAGDASVRGTTTHDDMQVFLVYDFINLVCQKSGKYSGQIWMHLISENSKFKDEIEFTMNGNMVRYQNGSSTKKHRSAPVMTFRVL
jgi:hypothetical protein